MIKQITLGKVSRLVNHEPFLMPDKLELDFNSVGYNLTSAFITLKNGEKKGIFKLTQPFTVPEEFLFAGLLNIEIKAYLNGELFKKWSVLPIKIIEADDSIEVFDLLADLDKRVKALEKQHEII